MNTRHDSLLARARDAWEREQISTGAAPQYPNSYSSVVSHGGVTYVLLVNLDGVIAVYEVTGVGALRRLAEFPDGALTAMRIAA